MANDPLFLVVAVAMGAVVVILLLGIGGSPRAAISIASTPTA